MTKKKPSPQNRIWEKERRDRLNQTFDSLAKLLPDYEPATQLSKIEILQKTIELVESLQDKIKASMEERDALLKKHVDELEERLQALIARNEDLAALLKKANINVPPCKIVSSTKEAPTEKQVDSSLIASSKNSVSKKNSPEMETNPELSPPVSKSVIEKIVTTSEAICTSSSIAVTSPVEVATTSIATIDSSASTVSISAPTIPSTCLVMANNQIVGTLQQTNAVNVTSALLPTPIMTTGVLISNNGNLLHMPMVPPTSSLLIVSNEDVRAKISMKKKRASSNDSKTAPKKGKSTGKLMIKSIDVIPGRIVNGKIPIPPLKRPIQHKGKNKKEVRKKRTRKHVNESQDSEKESSEPKKAKIDDTVTLPVAEPAIDQNIADVQKRPEAEHAEINPVIPVEEDKSKEGSSLEEQANSLDMNLDQGDLSADIFANLQVPEADDNQGSLSPTAAYLLNFPLVATGGKASGNQGDGAGDIENVDDVETDKKTATNQNSDTLLLDNFSSYFNAGGYGTLDSIIQPLSETPTTTVATSTSYPTTYQSIDSMLEHKTSRTTSSSDCRYNSAPFTFTLTSTTPSISTQSSFEYKHSSSSNYFYSTSVASTKPIEDYCLLKPPIVSEFTFSLTSTTPSAPKTVQSQYTNSTIFSSTITTPSYSTYGYQSKSSNKAASYISNYIPDAATSSSKTPKKYDLLEAEKPATSFTFSLTSTVKSLPKYTHSSVTTSLTGCATQHPVTVASSVCAKVDDCLYKASKLPSQVYLHKTPTKQKISSYPVISNSNTNYQTASNTQSKYDVNWMASQDPKPTVNQDYSQLLPSLDFNTTSYQTNFDLSRKSDIFFAHPTGEENLVSWSPNKLTNILNDTTSSYYPSTTTSLPNLNGDLALNSIPTYQSSTAKPTTQRKPNDSGSTFHSVQQLVDQPRKNTSKNYSNYTGYSSTQKSLNNNYSAEALIATPSTSSSTKKDPSYNSCNTYGTSDTTLAFNFDYSTEYNKGYNYSCQQNYMPSFMDKSYGLSSLPPPAVTAPVSAASYTNYGYSTDKKSSGSYYQSSSYQTTSTDIPYYVPSSEKRAIHQETTPTKSKKHHKQLPPSDYSSAAAPNSTSSYFPAILPPPPSLPDDPLCYNNFNFNPPQVSMSGTSSNSYSQPYQSTAAVPNYSFGTSTNQLYQATTAAAAATNINTTTPAAAGTGSSLANFNLSTICPEINEKSGGGGLSSSSGSTVSSAIPVRHAITGGAGW